MGYPSETNIEIKSREVSFAYIWLLSYPIAFEMLHTAVLLPCVIYSDSKVNGAHLGPTGPRWTPCWPQELYYLGNNLEQLDNCNGY